jgi:Fur family transcriptional regulator, iron response regulator
MRVPLTDRKSTAALLLQRGITPTSQRVDIALLMLARPQHLSADQILCMVNEHYTASSKATVYNTLKLFLSKGLVREVIVDPSKVFYDSNVGEHHHIYDMDSGQLIDIEGPLTVQGLPELPPGVSQEGLDVIVRVRRTGGGVAAQGGDTSRIAVSAPEPV